jgi:AraC-like DNA-binding protein
MGNFVLDLLRGIAPTMKVVSLPRARHRLHVMPTTAGCEVQTGSDYSWDGRRRGQKPFTVLQHTISGAGWLRFEQRRFRVVPGETLIVTVPHDHCYWVEDGGRWEFFWISMTGQEALRIHRDVLAATGPVLRLSEATIEHLASCCLRIVENANLTPGLASALAYEALMALYDEFSGEAASMAEQLGPIGRAVDHLRAHAGDRIAVGELAAATGYTRAHFSRKFARAIGTPPALYARKERLRRAASVLAANPGTTIKQVARLLGFEDPNYFAKVFRRTFGVSPTEYRQRGASAPRPAPDASEEPPVAARGEAVARKKAARIQKR